MRTVPIRTVLIQGVAVAGFLITGLAASAQPRYDYGWGREPLDRVRADLDRAARDMRYLSGGEYHRFEHARDEIREFQQKWNRGRFDRHELDDVIGSLQKVVNGNRIRPRDRDFLLNDLARLRDIRSRSGGFYRR